MKKNIETYILVGLLIAAIIGPMALLETMGRADTKGNIESIIKGIR